MKLKLALLGSVASVALVTPFASEVLETVLIQTDAGPVRINASDYSADHHTLVEGQGAPAQTAVPFSNAPAAPPAPVPPSNTPPATPEAPPASNPAPAPVAPPAPATTDTATVSTTPPAPPAQTQTEKFVTKTGKKWFVTDKDGNKLDANHAGFDSEAEAQAAAKA